MSLQKRKRYHECTPQRKGHGKTQKDGCLQGPIQTLDPSCSLRLFTSAQGYFKGEVATHTDTGTVNTWVPSPQTPPPAAALVP